MPKRTTRDKYKRKLDQCSKLCDNIEVYLSEMFSAYNETHPEIGLQLAMLLEANNQYKEALERFNKEL